MQAMQNTQPHPEARFWDRIAKRYAEKPVDDQDAYDTKLAKTDTYLKATDQVLEIGCGTGTTALHHAANVAHIRATDLSPAMLEIARTKAHEAGVTNVDFEVASIDELRADSQSYDVILAHSILHLLPDVDQVLSQLRSLLKPGGLLISTTACIGDFFPLLRYVAPLGRKVGLMPYVSIFREADLTTWHTDAGFEIEYRWQPKPKSGLYLIARKAEAS